MDSRGFVLFPSENLGFIEVRFYADMIREQTQGPRNMHLT